MIYLAVVCLSVGVVTGLAAVLYKKSRGEVGRGNEKEIFRKKRRYRIVRKEKKALFF
ncbi:MAG: hypothetical protein L6V85_06370 [Clostridiales bacterium]|nr:MAG: hypothetical protein L6V85_06370 [Clostridiales bacterium]